MINSENNEIKIIEEELLKVLIRGEKVFLPDLGYIEVITLPDKKTVLFRNNKNWENSQQEISPDLIFNNLSDLIKKEKIVHLPLIGNFRLDIFDRNFNNHRVSFIVSPALKNRLNGNSIILDSEEESKDHDVIIQNLQTNDVRSEKSDILSTENCIESPIEIKSLKEISKEYSSKTEEKDNNIESKRIEKKRLLNSSNGKRVKLERKCFSYLFIFIPLLLVLVFYLFWAFTTPKNTEEDISSSSNITYNLLELAEKHYGNTVFWIYIYDYNRDKIKSPLNIPVEVKIEIPDLSIYGINVQDSSEIERAIILANTILNVNNKTYKQ